MPFYFVISKNLVFIFSFKNFFFVNILYSIVSIINTSIYIIYYYILLYYFIVIYIL